MLREIDQGPIAEAMRLLPAGMDTPRARVQMLAIGLQESGLQERVQRGGGPALAMGYQRLITYTLPEEGGASLRASGFALIGQAGGGSWSRPSRPRVDLAPLQQKLRWEMAA